MKLQERKDSDQIKGKVDKLSNEPEDLRYGKFIYDGLRELFLQTDYNNDLRARELFLTEVYKLEDKMFFGIIRAVINNKIGPNILSWAQNTVNDILSDLRDDDVDDIDGVDTNTNEPDDDIDFNSMLSEKNNK